MQIFIETNKSQNEYASKESYVTYDENIHLASSGRTASTASDINPYMEKAPELTPDEQFKLEHQIKFEHGPGSQEYQQLGATYDMLSPDETFNNDFDKIQKYLKQMIYESNPITLDEKGEIVAIMNDSAMRVAVTEVLQEINAPRIISNIDCLKILSDILRFILTLFVHEQNIDFEFLSAMLDCSHFLYFF